MSRPYLVHCGDCGQPRYARYRNTKFCLTCRYLRDSTYWHRRGAGRPCVVCGGDYLPFHGTHKMCARCSFVPPDDRGTCAFCNCHNAALVPEHEICFSCATDPAQRVRFLEALAARQARQRDEYGHLRGTPMKDLRREAVTL